ncbi:MAG: gfo/Idh/MocA family oxidoreductase, partial [Candidatus Hydrogenedentes bacterium]|nr:gfo/Idh/MocA family oxidoreductase [Candidatus Hydrogenedentota bacterium]
MQNESERPITRRGFLGVAAAMAGPLIRPSSARGKDGAVAPSELLTMGCIGIGKMGTTDLQNFLGNPGVRVLAVCDVHAGRRNHAKALVDA